MSTSGAHRAPVAQGLEVGAEPQFGRRADPVADAGHVGMRLGVGHGRLDEAVVAQDELEVAPRPVEEFAGGSRGTAGRTASSCRRSTERSTASMIRPSLDPNCRKSVTSLTPASWAMRRVVAPRNPGVGKDLHGSFEQLFAHVHGHVVAAAAAVRVCT